MQRVVDDATNNQNLLNTANVRINNIMNDLNNFIRREQMVTQAWREERIAHQLADAEIIDLRRTDCMNVRNKCKWKRRYTACVQQGQNLRTDYQQAEFNRAWIFN